MFSSTQKLAGNWRMAKDWTSRVRFEGLDNYIWPNSKTMVSKASVSKFN